MIESTDRRLFKAQDFAELSLFVPPPFVGFTYAELADNSAYRWNGAAWEPLANIEPARTLFVSESWPDGANPEVFFTKISDALVQSATMSPSDASPIAIQIAPGTYPDPLVLVSNVHLSNTGRRACQITGSVTWTPGSGVNLPQAGLREEVDMLLLTVTGSISIVSSKTADQGVLDARSCVFKGGVSCTGRLTLNDYFQLWTGQLGGGTATFDNMNVNIFSSTTEGLTFTGVTAIDMRACEVFGDVTMGGTTLQAAMEGSQISGKVDIATGTSALFTGSVIGFSLTVAAGGSADIRAGVCNTLVGPGDIARNLANFSFGPTAPGVNPVLFSAIAASYPPFPSGAYSVQVTQTAGAPNSPPLVTAKAGTGFSLDDAVGGRTFDISIALP